MRATETEHIRSPIELKRERERESELCIWFLGFAFLCSEHLLLHYPYYVHLNVDQELLE